MVKKTILKIIGALFVLFVVLMALRMLVGGGEDTWICVDGEWVKHGVPAADKSQDDCGD